MHHFKLPAMTTLLRQRSAAPASTTPFLYSEAHSRELDPRQFKLGILPGQHSAEPEGASCNGETTRKCQSVITIPIGSCKHPVADLYL